ncbi:MAG: hypothetical protein WC862_00865 [Patescibacteria group bacterium]
MDRNSAKPTIAPHVPYHLTPEGIALTHRKFELEKQMLLRDYAKLERKIKQIADHLGLKFKS